MYVHILVNTVATAQKFDRRKTWTNEHAQNFDKLIVGFIGKILEKEVGRETFDKSVAVCQIHQTFPPSNFYAIATVYLHINTETTNYYAYSYMVLHNMR